MEYKTEVGKFLEAHGLFAEASTDNMSVFIKDKQGNVKMEFEFYSISDMSKSEQVIEYIKDHLNL